METAKQDSASLTFILWFALVFALLEGLYFLLPNTILNQILYPLLFTEPAAFLINLAQTDIKAFAHEGFLRAVGVNLQIVRGCDGSGVLFLLFAAILVFKTDPVKKIIGLLSGFIFVYLVNMIRIIAIFFIVKHQPAYFVEFHSLIAPSIIVLLTAFAFLFWVNWSSKHVSQ